MVRRLLPLLLFLASASASPAPSPSPPCFDSAGREAAPDSDIGASDAFFDAGGNRAAATVGTTPVAYGHNSLNQMTSVTVGTNTEQLVYDEDGNLVRDGDFLYAWDAENRLVEVRSINDTNGAVMVRFVNDHAGRRAAKEVHRHDGTGWSHTGSRRYVHDGLQLLEERFLDPADGAVTQRVNYAWGLDVSGRVGGAAGVGGLVAILRTGGGTTETFHVHSDHAGNVSQITGAGGELVAHYEYDPFGNVVVASGRLARANSVRFSSKYHDEETGLVYYGLRYHHPGRGRWLNRDPLGEAGGLNLYGFVGNRGVNAVDPTGESAFALKDPTTRNWLMRKAVRLGSRAGEGLNDRIWAYRAAQARGEPTGYAMAVGLAKSARDLGLGLVRLLSWPGRKLYAEAGLALGLDLPEPVGFLLDARVGWGDEIFEMGYEALGIEEDSNARIGGEFMGAVAFELVMLAAEIALDAATGGLATPLIVAHLSRWVGRASLAVGRRMLGRSRFAVCRMDDWAKTLLRSKRARLGCFPAGTLVLAASGAMAIEEVAPGDRVRSWDPATGVWCLREVEATSERWVEGDIVGIVLPGGERVEATWNHPVFVSAGRDLHLRPYSEEVSMAENAAAPGRWVRAGDLRVGEAATGNGASVQVMFKRGISWKPRTERT